MVCRGEPDVSASGAMEDFLIKGQRKGGSGVAKELRSDRRHLLAQPHGPALQTPSHMTKMITAAGSWKKQKTKKKKESLEENTAKLTG